MAGGAWSILFDSSSEGNLYHALGTARLTLIEADVTVVNWPSGRKATSITVYDAYLTDLIDYDTGAIEFAATQAYGDAGDTEGCGNIFWLKIDLNCNFAVTYTY